MDEGVEFNEIFEVGEGFILDEKTCIVGDKGVISLDALARICEGLVMSECLFNVEVSPDWSKLRY